MFSWVNLELLTQIVDLSLLALQILVVSQCFTGTRDFSLPLEDWKRSSYPRKRADFLYNYRYRETLSSKEHPSWHICNISNRGKKSYFLVLGYCMFNFSKKIRVSGVSYIKWYHSARFSLRRLPLSRFQSLMHLATFSPLSLCFVLINVKRAVHWAVEQFYCRVPIDQAVYQKILFVLSLCFA